MYVSLIYRGDSTLSTHLCGINPGLSWRNSPPTGSLTSKGKDVVQCYQCGVTIHTWLESDDVAVEHFRHSPTCSLALEGMKSTEQSFADGNPEEIKLSGQRAATSQNELRSGK